MVLFDVCILSVQIIGGCMKYIFDATITVFEKNFSPYEIVKIPYRDGVDTYIFVYHIDYNEETHTIYLSHFSNDNELFAIAIRKGKYLAKQFVDGQIGREYACSFSVRITELEKEVELLIKEHKRYTDMGLWYKNIDKAKMQLLSDLGVIKIK